MMMKKWISFTLAALLCLSLFGCGSDDEKQSPSPSPEPSVTEEPAPEETPEPVYVKIGTVHDVDSFLNIRSGPGTTYDVIGKAYANDQFVILTEFYNENWHQVEFEGGIAYIHADYLWITLEPVSDDGV